MAGLISSIEAHRTAQREAGAKGALLSAISDAILSAALTGKFSLDYDVTNQVESDILYVADTLNNARYIVESNSTNLNVSW